MERWKELQLIQLSRTNDIQIAYRIALNFAKNIGYKFCGFSTIYATTEDQLKTFRFNNYPKGWNAQYEKNKLYSVDPVVAHCNQSMLPILWSEDLYNNIPSMWDSLETQGFQHGWSQAFHDEESGLRSILSLARSHRSISALELYEHLGFSVFIGRHLHKLVAPTLPMRPVKPPGPHLSPREIDVLKLAADGKTAYESARILNLSARTVNFHVQESIRKLGVSNKVSAVIAAAKAGHLDSKAMS